jgi:hypothetical protein
VGDADLSPPDGSGGSSLAHTEGAAAPSVSRGSRVAHGKGRGARRPDWVDSRFIEEIEREELVERLYGR